MSESPGANTYRKNTNISLNNQHPSLVPPSFGTASCDDPVWPSSTRKEDNKKLPSMEMFCDIVENMSMQKIMELFSAGLELRIHLQKAGQLISLPLGWFCFELAIDGAVLVSVRKGYFLKKNSQKSIDDYTALIKLLQRCGKNTERYEEVLALLKADG